MSEDFIIEHKEDIYWVSLFDSCVINYRSPLSENILIACFNIFNEECWEYIFGDTECDLSENFIHYYIENINIILNLLNRI